MADRSEPTPYELLDALVAAHRQVDQLMAMIIMRDNSFFPSRSPLWPEIEKRADILKRFGRL